jgi:Arm DNA-binding domain
MGVAVNQRKIYPLLTELSIKKVLNDARKAGKSIKRGDQGGLFVYVTPAGSVLWRHKFRFNDIEQLDSFGPWPETSIREARDRHFENRRLLAKGINPVQMKKHAKRAVANTFADVAEEYVKQQEGKLAQRTVDKARWQLRVFINPSLGKNPIREIRAEDLLEALRKIESRGKTVIPPENQRIKQLFITAAGRKLLVDSRAYPSRRVGAASAG